MAREKRRAPWELGAQREFDELEPGTRRERAQGERRTGDRGRSLRTWENIMRVAGKNQGRRDFSSELSGVGDKLEGESRKIFSHDSRG
jgi:hypothetical protein